MRAITQSISSLIFLISVFSISAYAQPITDSGVGSPITEKGTLEFTVYVPSNGMTTEARVVRKKNTYYYLVVSGSAYFSRYDRPGGQLMNDACYEFNSKPRPVPMDVLKNNQNVNVCNSRYNRNSQYRTKSFIPKGPLRFWIFDTDYRDNSRGLRVDVYRLNNQQGNKKKNLEDQTRNPSPIYSVHTDNTKWCVGAVDRNNNKLKSHHQPWHFQKNHLIEAKGYWRGNWKSITSTEIQANTVDKQGTHSQFTVVFKGDRLYGYLQGKLFRIGIKTISNRCQN